MPASLITIQKHPFFSILVPTFNQADYLPYALDSIIAQTMDSWEAVIVNDGSTDNTDTILKNYSSADPRFKIYNQENGGCGAALNTGLKNSRGKWICWLSSDDLFEPDKLETHLKWINAHKNIKFFYSHFFYLNEESGDKTEPDLWRPLPPKEFQVSRFFQGNYVHGNSIAIHSDVFKEIGFFNESLRYGQDFEMWLRISSKYPSLFINKRTCVTRWHSHQTTNDFPVAGLYDSARACHEFINTHSFEDFFPQLDLSTYSHAIAATHEILKIAMWEGSYIYQCGYSTALLERIREWITNYPSTQTKESVFIEIAKYTKNHSFKQIPMTIKLAFESLIHSKLPYKYRPCDFQDILKKTVKNPATDPAKRENLKRYIKNLVKNDL